MGILLLHSLAALRAQPLLAALLNVDHLIEVSGYPLIIVLVMAESGGIPVPGETALIVGGIFASQGKLRIELVIAAAALGAIVGDNIGYYIGRRGGRWLLQRPGPFHGQRLRVLEMGEPFFERHGPKAVFFGRFVLGLRTWASWLAGANHMRWRTFFLWNALGGISWAVGVGLIAYFLGSSAGNLITSFGIYGLAAVLIAAGGAFVWHRRHTREARGVAAHDSTSPMPPPHEPLSAAGDEQERSEPVQP
jgi:membrane protein DedA with SNARE-associated domain